MRHKAQAIYDYVIGNFNQQKIITLYLTSVIPVEEGSIVGKELIVNIQASFDTFNVPPKVSYIDFTFFYKDDKEKAIMSFSINSAGGMFTSEPFQAKDTLKPPEKYLDVLLDEFNLEHLFKGPISVKEIEPIPPGSNPYLFDHDRAGIPLAGGWEFMYLSSNDGIRNVVLVNTRNGRRFDLDLYEASKPQKETK